MNELTGLKPKTCINHIEGENGDMIKKPSITANIVKDHFCSIHRTVNNRAQPGSNVHVDRLKTANHSELQNNNFKIPFVTCAFVENQLTKLDITKTSGSDGISHTFLKLAAPIISSVLPQIFNLSIAKSDFPSPFKLANVIPIHKRGPKADHFNYRPISMLPITSLILERHVNYWLKRVLRNKFTVISKTIRF